MGCHAFCYCNFFSWRPKLKYYYSILLHNVFPGSAIGDWCGRCMKWIQGESIDLAEPWQWLPALLGNDCFGPGRGGPLTISDVFLCFFHWFTVRSTQFTSPYLLDSVCIFWYSHPIHPHLFVWLPGAATGPSKKSTMAWICSCARTFYSTKTKPKVLHGSTVSTVCKGCGCG